MLNHRLQGLPNTFGDLEHESSLCIIFPLFPFQPDYLATQQVSLTSSTSMTETSSTLSSALSHLANNLGHHLISLPLPLLKTRDNKSHGSRCCDRKWKSSWLQVVRPKEPEKFLLVFQPALVSRAYMIG